MLDSLIALEISKKEFTTFDFQQKIKSLEEYVAYKNAKENALKDYHLAYLVGERTYGKGSVQQVIPLSDIDGFKITMARYYTPSDVNIDKIGIPPDFEIANFTPLTKEQEETYVKLIESNVIEKTVAQNPNMTEALITEKANAISVQYKIEARIIRKLLRNEVQRKMSTPLYDLDYDLQLNKAIKIINSGEYRSLLNQTKTLKQLQEAVELEEKKSK